MSYKDPQQVIDQRYSVISKGLANLYKTVGSSMTNWNKIRQKRQKELDKRLTAQMKPIETEFNRILDDTRAFTGGLSDREDAAFIQTQVQENLLLIRNTLARDLSNTDLTKSEILNFQQLALTDMNSLSEAVINMGLADDELVTGKTLTGRNDDLALLIKELSADGRGLDLYNEEYRRSRDAGEEYQNGKSVYYLANINRDDVITVNMKDIAQQQKENPDSTFFIQNENPSNSESKYYKNWEEFISFITTEGTKKNPGLLGREEFMEGDKLNVNKLKDYLTNDPGGQNLVNELFGGIDERGYLRSKATEDVSEWTEYDQGVGWDSENNSLKNYKILVDHLVEDALIDTQFPSGNIFREPINEAQRLDAMEEPVSEDQAEDTETSNVLTQNLSAVSQSSSYTPEKIKEIGERITSLEKAYGMGVGGAPHDRYGFSTGVAPKDSKEAQERFAKEYGAEMIDGLDDEILFQTIDWKFNANRSGKHLLLYATGKLGEGIEGRSKINKNFGMTDAEMDKLFDENKAEIIV